MLAQPFHAFSNRGQRDAEICCGRDHPIVLDFLDEIVFGHEQRTGELVRVEFVDVVIVGTFVHESEIVVLRYGDSFHEMPQFVCEREPASCLWFGAFRVGSGLAAVFLDYHAADTFGKLTGVGRDTHGLAYAHDLDRIGVVPVIVKGFLRFAARILPQ